MTKKSVLQGFKYNNFNWVYWFMKCSGVWSIRCNTSLTLPPEAKICPHFEKCVADDYSQIVATYTFVIDGTSYAGPLQIQNCYLVKHNNILCYWLNILWLFRHEGVAKVFIFKHTAHLLYILCPNGSADINFFSLKYGIFMAFCRARYHHFRIFRCASFGACGGVFFLSFLLWVMFHCR